MGNVMQGALRCLADGSMSDARKPIFYQDKVGQAQNPGPC